MPANKKLKKLIVALYYPAVLGTGFLVIVLKSFKGFDHAIHTVSFWFTVVLLFYFSISYLVSDAVDESGYKPSLFWCDLIEVFLVLALFWTLGFADASSPQPGAPEEPNMPAFYLILALVPFFQLIWHLCAGHPSYMRLINACICWVVVGAGYFRYPHWRCRDWILVGVLAGLAVLYSKVAKT